MGLGEGTKFGLVWGQFGGFKTSTFYRLIGSHTSPSVCILHQSVITTLLNTHTAKTTGAGVDVSRPHF